MVEEKVNVPKKGETTRILWGIVSDGIPVLQDPKYYQSKKREDEKGKHN